MRRADLYRLWTSGGLLAAAALLTLESTVVASSRRAWRGDGLWAVQQLGAMLEIGLPLFLVLFCLPPVLRGGAHVDHSLAPSGEHRARLRRFVVDAGAVVAVHLAFVTAALAWTRTNGDEGPWPPILMSVTLQVVAILAIGALGRGVGEALRHPAAALVAAALGMILVGFASNAVPVSAGNSPYAGLELATRDYLPAAVLLLVLTLVVLLRPRGQLLGGVVVGLASVALVAAGQWLDEPDLRPSGDRPSECRPEREVRVCVFPGYSFMSNQIAGPVHDTLDAFAAHGIRPHIHRVEQSTPGRIEEAGTIAVPFDEASLKAGDLAPSSIRASLLHPTWCPRINSPEPLPARFDANQRNVYHWLEHAVDLTSDAEYARAVPRFAGLSEDVQRARVQDFLDRNHTCDGLT